ncbi:hypothetical protein SAMD00019534_063070 [Acytostelium subglobosum LB1]|uniref:hypothetical protein n=1 Tax=Acytostelium subglobosum LB1 TaxID=1410327 RepID=UPI000644D25E|nr:hypothetical protein SAMD00019534_063070 [Acytostelium subglobosum LB1]GAM23132.1 hypothetical protein SAMD00019534_063070 [Acytostelium subglobosum LB1]|eukprot:XP_012753581.1 hypothetical protein SAMD00019534_063070 [Acytostelium subglobosum LB1]
MSEDIAKLGLIRWRNKGRIFWVWVKSGWGLPRHMLDRVQMTFWMMLILVFMFMPMLIRGSMAPMRIRSSRALIESPAMLPSAQTHCSCTSRCGLLSKLTKICTEPLLITCSV